MKREIAIKVDIDIYCDVWHWLLRRMFALTFDIGVDILSLALPGTRYILTLTLVWTSGVDIGIGISFDIDIC